MSSSASDTSFPTGAVRAAGAGLACRACGVPLLADSRFCSACGTPVAPDSAAGADAGRMVEGSAPVGIELAERKQVTVLFVSAHGALDLGLALETEDWHRILSRFYALLDAAVQRYGGVVDRFTGEGIKARFGAPVAREGHARDACRAALDLSRELRAFAAELRRSDGIAFAFRMGLNSGEVLFGPIGDGLGTSYSAQGTTAALAARMEQLADPGKIYLAAATAALVRDEFALRDLGSFNVKGFAHPLRAYELDGPLPEEQRLASSRARLRARFVGRRRELALLESALERAMGGGGSAFLGVVGEPGVGKTRLSEEFRLVCEARGIDVQVLRAGPDAPYTPGRLTGAFLRDQFGLSEKDSAQIAREKIAGRLALLDPDLLECCPAVFDLLEVSDGAPRPEPLAPADRVRQVERVVYHLFATDDARMPRVILVDDRQWTDPFAEDVTAQLIERGLPGDRVVVSFYRSGYCQPWMLLPRFQEVHLGPLDDAEADALIASLLGGHPSLRGIARQIRERSAGNPFFLEEVVRELAESSAIVGQPGDYRLGDRIAPLSVPPSLQSVLAARIDGLPEREKAVLGIASVIGLRVPDALLGEVSGLAPEVLRAALEGLEAAHVLDRAGGTAAAAHRFRHPLLRETAYRSLVRAKRTRLHAATARALCAIHGDAVDEQAGTLAGHWADAGNPLEAARWHRRAAERSAAQRPEDALEHWRQIRLLLATEEAPDALALRITACRRLLRLARERGPSGTEPDACFAEGARLARQISDPRSIALLTASYGHLRGMVGTAPEAVAHSHEALLLAEQSGDPQLRAKLSNDLAMALYVSGDLRGALALTRCLAQADRGAVQHPSAEARDPIPAHVLLPHAMALLAAGELPLGREVLDRALAAARSSGQPALVVWALGCYPSMVSLCGDATGQATAEAACFASEALSIADRVDGAAVRAAAYRALGTAQLLERRFADAAESLERAKQVVLSRQTSFHVDASLLASLAEAYRGQARVALACETAREAVALARRRGTRVPEIDALLALARALYRADRHRANPEIDQALKAALALVAPTGARSREPQIHVGLAKAARLNGQAERAAAELRRAYAGFLAIGAAGHAARTARLLR